MKSTIVADDFILSDCPLRGFEYVLDNRKAEEIFHHYQNNWMHPFWNILSGQFSTSGYGIGFLLLWPDLSAIFLFSGWEWHTHYYREQLEKGAAQERHSSIVLLKGA